MLQLAVLIAWIALLAVTFILASLSKDPSLRAAAGIYVIAYIFTIFAENWRPHWGGPQIGVLLIDTMVAIAFAVILARQWSYWSIFACGFQVAMVGFHLAYMLSPLLSSRGYIVALITLSFLAASSIALGALNRMRPAKA